MTIGFGEGMTLLGALLFAVHIVFVSKFAREYDVLVLTVFQFLTEGALGCVMGASFETPPLLSAFTPELVASMAFLAVFASVVAFGIQNVSLAYVPPSQASLFLSLESVFGVLFSVMLYGEQIGLRLVMGFALIFVAIVVSETFPLKRREPQAKTPLHRRRRRQRRHLMAQESERSNIVLIGMPGAGKSTLGIVLAKILNYNFIDADLVIQNQCDKTLQKLIDACGPEGFIQVENQILSDLTAERSIIATAGRPCTPTRP